MNSNYGNYAQTCPTYANTNDNGNVQSYTEYWGGPSSNPWEIQWKLSQKSKSGGWIVQSITTKNSNGKQLYKILEAWQVPANSQFTSYYPDPKDDKFSTLLPGVKTNAQARFYEGLKLPESFIPNNPKTDAGILPSTSLNPYLPINNASAPVVREWTPKEP